jgi:hypothetical protein
VHGTQKTEKISDLGTEKTTYWQLLCPLLILSVPRTAFCRPVKRASMQLFKARNIIFLHFGYSVSNLNLNAINANPDPQDSSSFGLYSPLSRRLTIFISQLCNVNSSAASFSSLEYEVLI